MAASRQIPPAAWHSPKESDRRLRRAGYACLALRFVLPAGEMLEGLFSLAPAFFMQRLQFLIREVLNRREFVGHAFHGQDEFRKLELNGHGVAVLRVLDQKHHEKRHDRGAGVDDKLPGIAKSEKRPCHRPDKNNDNREQERSGTSGDTGRLLSKNSESFLKRLPRGCAIGLSRLRRASGLFILRHEQTPLLNPFKKYLARRRLRRLQRI